MDVIEEFLNKASTSNKIKASDFFKSEEHTVTCMLYNELPEITPLNLKKFWVDVLKEYGDYFILDFNLVDWRHLAFRVLRKNSSDKEYAKINQEANEKIAERDEIDEFFNSGLTQIPFNIDILSLQNQFNNERKKLERCNNIHEQDYVYYGILDFVSKMNNKKTMILLSNDYDKWNEELTGLSSQYTNEFDPMKAHKYVKEIVSGTLLAKSKLNEKKAKRNLDKSDLDYVWKKKALRIIKLQRHRINDDLTLENEYSFMIDYFSKLLTSIFYLKKELWKFKWGEAKLNASKEEENLAKFDNENRSVGPSIDAILASKIIGLDFLVVEISGPMLKEDYVHYLKDRLKIAKSLKHVFKSILRQKLIVSSVKNLRLYGIQVYKNIIYLYSLSMPIMNLFCFVKVMEFKIPLQASLFSKELPHYFKELIKMLGYVLHGYRELEEYMTSHEDYDSDESHNSSNTLSPPYVSPVKAGMKRKK
ncbi:hypothetical protein BD770DRAFT_356515 [Pilaira anomala]|nr:hypothetical protein BD770DRAFT_356515 [Pilaira anomala]